MKSLVLTICLGLLLFPVFTQTTKTAKTDSKKTVKKPTPSKSPAKKPANTRTSTAKPKPAAKKSSDTKSAAKTKTTAKKTDNRAAGAKPKATSKKANDAKTAANKPKTSAKRTADTKSASTKPKTPAAKPKPKPSPEKPVDDKAEFEKAAALEDAIEKINSLRKFLAEFPKSAYKQQAQELLATTAAVTADEKVKTGDSETALALYRLAADSAPKPIPEKLFTDSISNIPNSLFWRGNRAEALDIAKVIESKIETNAGQLINLTAFYVGIENGEDAVRLAEKAVQLDSTSSNAYQTLGLARRVNFQLEEAAAAYAKAVELDAESVNAKRSLAEMKRALGKSDEAVTLYREIFAKDEANIQVRTGLILSLFDAGKRSEAESEMAKSLEQNPNNVILLAGAAYWYAAHNDSEKAIEIAQKAVANEPRYIWSHIALARGFMNQNRPVEAEEVLLKARQYGNFPTLEYEIASARLKSGFYRDAADELSKSFSVVDGSVQTRLGGRVARKDKNFTDLLSLERKASILEPAAADDPENAARLKALLEFTQKMKGDVKEDDTISAADAFVRGDDKMKLYRDLYAASLLLDKKVALAKVLDLTKAAVGNTDAALNVPNAGAAVMASELYESRITALTRNEFIRVPDVPRQTLSAILRGRIEEITGRALYAQSNFPEAVIRLRRAVSVMPDKSAWWRSSMWWLGAALQADGKEKEALDTYIKSYKIDKPDMVRYSTVEALYKKLNGSTDGLEAKVGPSPLQAISTAAVAQTTEPVPEPKIEPTPEAKSAPTPESSPVPAKEEPKVELTPEPSPSNVKKEPKAVPTSDASKEVPKVDAAPVIVKEEPKTEPLPEPSPIPTPMVESTPAPPPVAEATPQPTPTAIVEPSPEATKPEKAIDTFPETNPSSDIAKPADTKKELFEPIVITIPKSNAQKPEEKIAKVEPEPSPSPIEKPATEETKTEKPAAEEKKTDAPPVPGETRPRVVEGKAIQAVEEPKCSITATQDTVSVINNGGSIGILIGVEGEGDIKAIKATSSSPDDVEVILEPEIAGVAGRVFFVIKSVSTKTGSFQIVFELSCGKKEIAVTVR